MKWIAERDALIAQTMAFVQSVTGKAAGLRRPDAPAVAPPVPTEIVSVQPPVAAPEIEPPPPVLPPQPLEVTPPPRTSGDFRSEMQARIANFRRHQERFEREREEYCAATLSKLRAAMRDVPPRPPVRK
ncbi:MULTISPECIES: hypothetical protein [unclassified Bradyrhizobium]|uniref:hypothetical protein n=1 Tax=unclassified Bradyrhizobium TaxID=2631580 RepID=UPI002478E83F|nr:MULTISPECIES: hypothetical protein [unclassified Bradyrhizobium]WGR74288.1 hypothetical protein MTX24_16295 [Bradyrhizobium sp. ISRA426]WGR79123.1 hypothetical protein MTX21_01410 [Bradyrhizobium sp. ISRA430]WGR89527.1 hypothetical protein MTX25_16310 [Bradyrhizobium sp. ISRA432]